MGRRVWRDRAVLPQMVPNPPLAPAPDASARIAVRHDSARPAPSVGGVPAVYCAVRLRSFKMPDGVAAGGRTGPASIVPGTQEGESWKIVAEGTSAVEQAAPGGTRRFGRDPWAGRSTGRWSLWGLARPA